MTRPPVALGDIHGRLDLLDAAISAFPDRAFVLLGDYCDRGPDSRGCIGRVRELVEAGRATALLGNHDLFMVEAVLRGQSRELWIRNGGNTTLDCYEGEPDALEQDARWMIGNLKPWHVEGGIMFAHAMRPDPLEINRDAHLWGRPGSTPVYPLPPGVTVSVHGHTPQEEPKRIRLRDGTALWLIDTGAVFYGRLCALDCQTWTPHIIT